jgi:hypothetical protein
MSKSNRIGMDMMNVTDRFIPSADVNCEVQLHSINAAVMKLNGEPTSCHHSCMNCSMEIREGNMNESLVLRILEKKGATMQRHVCTTADIQDKPNLIARAGCTLWMRCTLLVRCRKGRGGPIDIDAERNYRRPEHPE